MNFDIKAVFSNMLAAVKAVAGSEYSSVRLCAQAMFGDEKHLLEELAAARLEGEIDDDTLAAELGGERETFVAALLAGDLLTRKMAQDAADAAIDAFRQALITAVGALVAADRAGGRGRRSAVRPAAFSQRKLNARPDTLDFRDLMYVPTLVEVGTSIPLAQYRKAGAPILDQGREGACTGYGLATVAHYLMRKRRFVPDRSAISPWMFYVLARRYDEWPGEAYEGSSCRGAMKGWHKHGVCSAKLWQHDRRNPDHTLSEKRMADARKRPLGAYFRVNHKDLVAMHAAISEVGVLYASASVHSGWGKVKADGIIPFENDMTGGHAFAIVAYDEEGLWIQNSWGASWGFHGFGKVSYEDWLKNGTDVWVTRLGVPLELAARSNTVSLAFTASSQAQACAFDDIRAHVVSIGNDGQLRTSGNIGTPPQQVRKILREDFPRITSGWKKRRIVLYAHGGLVSENAAVQRVAEYRRAMLEAQCYPLAFIWNSDYWTTLTDLLEDALRLRRPEGVLDKAKDFMLDRLDDALEPIARKLTGKAEWDEMSENASLATSSAAGGARLVLQELAALVAADPKIEIHLVGHSAGSIFHAPLVQMLTAQGAIAAGPLRGQQGLGLSIASCTLWAPACTMSLFEEAYLPAIEAGAIKRFALYTLTDRAEQDDQCANIYHKSLLYLVSNAFGERARIPVLRPEGEPLLGMAKFIETGAAIQKLIRAGQLAWVQAPNNAGANDLGASAASHHGDFDDDNATVSSTLARILNAPSAAGGARRSLSFSPGASARQNFRSRLDRIAR